MKRWRHLIVAVCLVPAMAVYVMLCLYLSNLWSAFTGALIWPILLWRLSLAVSGWPGHL